MAFNKAQSSVIRTIRGTFRASKESANFAKRNVVALSGSEEKEESVEEHLSTKERKAWARLPRVKRQRYKDKGIQTAKREEMRKRGSAIVKTDQIRKAESAAAKMKQTQKAGSSIAKINEKQGSLALKTGGAIATSGNAVATGGTSLVLKGSKKTAETFKQYLQGQNQMLQQKMVRQQSKIEVAKNIDRQEQSVQSRLLLFSALLSGVVIQGFVFAAQALTAMLTSLITILIPVIALTVIVSMLASVLSMIFASSSTYAGYDLPPFVTEEMMEALFHEQTEKGIPVSTGLAQLIQESGFGVYGPNGSSGQGLSKLAYDHKNLFGMKIHSCQYVSGSVNMRTGEEAPNGSHYQTNADFATFQSYADSIKCRTANLYSSSYFGGIKGHLNQNDGKYKPEDANAFITSVGSVWATDSSYAKSCIRTMENYNLYQFDNMNYEQYQAGTGEISNIMIGDYAHPCPKYSYVSSHFGYRASPGGIGSTNHKGVDLAAANGTPIYAVKEGRVVTATFNSARGYYVRINHGEGFETISQHMTNYVVSEGQQVKQGELIGYVGSTGASTGGHLHFEILIRGVNVDPEKYMHF